MLAAARIKPWVPNKLGEDWYSTTRENKYCNVDVKLDILV